MSKFPARLWLLLILLGAFALRLFRLGANSLWYDETVSVYLARQDLVALTRHTAGDIHPPLYYYLLHFWGTLAGWSEFSAAFLSLVLGVLLVALAYRAAREWLDRDVALITAFVVAISPYNLWYSQEVRMYTLGAALGLASMLFLLRVLSQRHRRVSRDLIAYVVVSALGLYTLYYFAFLLIFENILAFIWIVRNRSAIYDLKSEILRWSASQLAIAVLYAPWIPIALRQALDPPVPPWRSFTPLSGVLLESFSALAFGQSVDAGAFAPLLVAVAVLLGFALGARRGLLLLGYTFVPLVLIYVLSLWKPLYHVRYLFIYAPGFYILLASGIMRLGAVRRRSRVLPLRQVALAVLLVASAYSAYSYWFDPRYREDDLRGAVRRLAAEWRSGDAILLDAGYTYTAFDYYYDGPVAWRGRLMDYTPAAADREQGAVVLQTGSIGGAPDLGWNSPESDFYATTADATRTALDRVFAVHPRVWLLRLYDTVVDPDGVVRDYLAQNARIIDDQGFAGESYARVQGYLTPRAALTALPASAVAREVVLGDKIVLKGYSPARATVRAGTSLDIDLYWTAREPTNVDTHLFIGLFDEHGELVVTQDALPLGNGFGTSRWRPGELLREPVRLAIPANVNGSCIVRIALYNPLTNEPLAAGPGEWVHEGSQIILTIVEVQRADR